LLASGLGGCAAPPARAPSATAAAPVVGLAAPWWRSCGDSRLARLVDDGLRVDPRLRREAAALNTAESRARHWRLRLVDAWRAALAGREPENLDAAARHLARTRLRKAEAIALTYVELRQLQAVRNLRDTLQAQFHDDARIAAWRREAGLASAVDAGLGTALIGVNADALRATDARLAAVRATLARSAGVAEAELAPAPGDAPPISAPQVDSGNAAPAADRAALAAAATRETALLGVARDAERTAADARAAYQLGSGDFATVYASEAALLDVREAALAARAASARAAIRLWTDLGLAAAGPSTNAGGAHP
jgi:outer membrane protein TolC